MKKFLLLFAALLTLSVTASAQDRIQVFADGDWAFAINPDVEHEVTVVHYQGKEGSAATELTIPSYATYNGSRYFVTALGESLFSEYNNEGNWEYTHWWSHGTFTKLEKVTIPNSVTGIGRYAFNGCTGLTSVTIPNSVTEIGNGAFSGCTSLTSVTIPTSVTEIGFSVFSGCTGLTSVTIPNSVTEIGGSAFSGCTNLQEFVLEDGNSKYTVVDGVIYNTTRTALIAYPGGKEGDFEIPNSVTEIGSYAFSGCTSLTSVTIPNSVTTIGLYAFSGCTGLTSVTIPNSVTTIGFYAFRGCTGLTSVTIPNSVTVIRECAFQNCTGLISVTIPNSVTKIENMAFYGCTGLTSVAIPNSVTTIEGWAFYGCTGLTSVTIPNSVTTIRLYAFSGCTALETIYALPATPPACQESNAFENVPETAVVYIPKGSFKAYFVEKGWDHFTDFREMGALDITLSESSISIEEGKTATLTATVTKDSDVTVESESWTSSDPEVATVDGDGLVTAVGAGSATISYTVVDGYGVPHSESCEVMVSAMTGIEGITAEGDAAPAEYFTLSGVRVNGEALTPGLYIKRQGGKAVKVLVK